MRTSHSAPKALLAASLALVALVASLAAAPGSRTLTFADLMRFRAIERPSISESGTVLAYGLQPDRGDGEGVVRVLASGREIKVERGGSPLISKNGAWVAMVIKPPLEATEKAGKDKPKPGMALVEAASGTVTRIDNVEKFSFSDDSKWVAWSVPAPEVAGGAGKTAASASAKEPSDGKAPAPGKPAATLKLRELATGSEQEIKPVAAYAFDPGSTYLAYVVAEPDGKGNGVFIRRLRGKAGAPVYSSTQGSPSPAPSAAPARAEQTPRETEAIVQADNAGYDNLAWSRDGKSLAFSSVKDKEKPADPSTIWVWRDGSPRAAIAVASSQAPAGWMLPLKNELTWSKDGSDLFFGFKPMDEKAAADAARKAAAHRAAMAGQTPQAAGHPAAAGRPGEVGAAKADSSNEAFDPFDFDQILAKAEVDVWHWNDPRIIPQQKVMWDREKGRTYRAVLHLAPAAATPPRGAPPADWMPSVVVLADRALPDVALPDNPRVALGTSDVPYLRETTWTDRSRNIFVVDLETGARKQVVSRLRDQASLSPDGRYVVFFADRQWRVYDVGSGATRVATESIGLPLYDEQHDTPNAPSSYGLGGWMDEGAALLVYDRYDIWKVPSAGGAPINLTGGEGRKRGVTFRVVNVDSERKWLSSREPLLLTAYHERAKNWGFYSTTPTIAPASSKGRPVAALPGVVARLDEKKLFKFVAKAKNADTLIYTREDFGEFPDLWVADSAFRQPRRVSDANPQIAEFAWGSPELVEYTSQDGVPLQGVLIKPANYQPGKRYPVITYFYERQSQRLYEFNEPVVNHRPSFPIYAASGYAVFLPDIAFTVGHPGQSMVKCLVPAVQKLVDMGVADPNALGLHGHSWGGYGTAYVVTQTDMFKAAVTGAPVANMTSAYGGIRWESGLARLFQYEQSQSRIGGTLWEKRDLYIENSALFFADRVRTPLLIEHGDEDGAVPWYQGIELYLALRRLGKDAIFLQYRGEPHHLRKYPNKLDYSIRMKQYFDHYLKGEPAAAWITEGVAYAGK